MRPRIAFHTRFQGLFPRMMNPASIRAAAAERACTAVSTMGPSQSFSSQRGISCAHKMAVRLRKM